MKAVADMTFDDMHSFLNMQYPIIAVNQIPHGKQIKLDGAVVNVYDTGKYLVQGKRADEVRARIESGEIVERPGAQKTNKVFVVYGHDEKAKNDLELLLRRWELEPIILDYLASGGQTVIEKLESNMGSAEFGIVLATPDDEGYKKDHPEEKMFRVRQNVVLELGMLLAKLGRDRVAVLLKDQEATERPSDIQGMIYIPFKNDLCAEAGAMLAKEIELKMGRVIPASKL